MKTIIYKAETRGRADHGWLKSNFSFSFAEYYNEERMGFGALRVLNDDTIEGGGGFPMHPHANMEIVTIPLQGELEHQDSMGNKKVIGNDGSKLDIQVMSAGTGVVHSEYNKSATDAVKLLQLWVLTGEKNVTPRYEEAEIQIKDFENKLVNIVSPKEDGGKTWIHQNAWFHLGNFKKDFSFEYEIKKSGNGLYIFVIDGSVKVDEEFLNVRDAVGITEAEKVEITSTSDSQILLVEVPMV